MVHIDNAKINLCIHFIMIDLVTNHCTVYVVQCTESFLTIQIKLFIKLKSDFLTLNLVFNTSPLKTKCDFGSSL